MKVLWVTSRPICAAEKKINSKIISGTWMAPILEKLAEYKEMQLFIVSVFGNDKKASFVENNVTYYSVSKGKSKTYKYNKKKNIELWKSIFCKVKPNVVMIWGTEYAHGLLVAKLSKELGIPCVLEIQGIMKSVEQYYMSNLTITEILKSYSLRNFLKGDGLFAQQRFFRKKAKIEKEMLDTVDGVLCENEWAKRYCSYISKGKKFYFHRQSVDGVFFDRTWDKCNFEKHSIITCFPGYPLKGAHILLKALAIVKEEFPDVKLYIPGMESPFRKSLFQRIKQQGYEKYLAHMIINLNLEDNVIFVGGQSSSGMADLFSRANVVVIPSSIENTSTTLREAMLVGVPCIGSYVGGIQETISHGENGYLFRHEDYIQLAAYISDIFQNDFLAFQLGDCARDHMLSYLNCDEAVSELVSIYNELVKT